MPVVGAAVVVLARPALAVAVSQTSGAAALRCRVTIRPAWLAPLADRIGLVVLGRDIRRRIAGYARGCADEVVLADARTRL